MSARRPTIAEQRYPDTPEFQQAARALMADALGAMLEATWTGYDLLRLEVLNFVPAIRRGDEGERSVTQLLAPRISRALTGFEAFYCQHSVREMETRKPAPAQAPEYDLAFILRANERICWPLEAKLLASHDAVAPYVRDIDNEFLTCRYAPFSSGGAMIGYLLEGDCDRFFNNVASRLGTKLIPLVLQQDRPHRTSSHRRKVPAGKAYPANFTCHHLLMLLG